MNFFEQLQDRAERHDTLLCVGLDPRPARFPPEILAQEDPIFAFNRQIIDATRDLVCAYKPNYAFYEAQGLPGLRALHQTIDYIGSEIPVILDAKRGDIGSTAVAYARAAFDVWGAGAVTVAPYLGGDSITPFTEYVDRGVFVLCHTSNPGASEVQGLTCTRAENAPGKDSPLYLHVARLAQAWSEVENVGLVVGATYPAQLEFVRSCAPQAWFLVPGIGTQGGDLGAAVSAGLRADGLGLIFNASRAICYADNPRSTAKRFRDQINAARAHMRTSPRKRLDAPRPRDGGDGAADRHTALILDLARIDAVRFGEFTLKSGKQSPVYIDLRLLATHPTVLGRVAAAYNEILQGINYDRIAAIPYAGLPIGTAVALQNGRPLIYPRKEVKRYGTRRAIEGLFEPGERAVVLDDLITNGESKIEAIAPLQEAGLSVQDVVVLIDRQSGGREVLARQGYRLHAVLTLGQIIEVLVAQGCISAEKKASVMNWLSRQ
jgi:uridine monophosphate synthetase